MSLKAYLEKNPENEALATIKHIIIKSSFE